MAGEVLPRSLIASQIWDMNFDSDTNVIDVAIRRLRGKIDDGHEIKLIHMRHEQATAYAADAYARMTGEAGVCMVTAGCGLTNAVTGLCLAAMTNSAVGMERGGRSSGRSGCPRTKTASGTTSPTT